MDPVYMEYTLTPQDYREMTYFNTFSIKRLQAVFVVVAWVASVVLLLLELAVKLPLTRIMHICFLVVSVALPVLVLNLEYAIHRFKADHCGSDAVRRIAVFNDEGVRHSAVKSAESVLDSWGSLLQIFELRGIFIIYKDSRHTVIVPKTGLSEQKLATLRTRMQTALGNRYSCRYKAKS